MTELNPTSLDAYKPSEIYTLVDQAGVQKFPYFVAKIQKS